MKKIIFPAIGILFLATVLVFFDFNENEQTIFDFESCVATQKETSLIYPGRCTAKDGRTFVQDIGNELEKTNLIRASSPRPGMLVKSPLTIEGEARGYWYFEASFPIKIIDSSGVEIARGIATAKEEWMTEEFVPFEAVLSFDTPAGGVGKLILMKDNPSGLPEHDDALVIPIKFSGE